MPRATDGRADGAANCTLAIVGAAVPATIGLLLTFRLTINYLWKLPGGDPLDKLAASDVIAFLVGLVIEIVAGIVIFKRLSIGRKII